MSYHSQSANPSITDDTHSEFGGMYESTSGTAQPAEAVGVAPGVKPGGVPVSGRVRSVDSGGRQIGRGPIPVDKRKFHYDVVRASTLPQIPFGASKADRLNAMTAGALLHRIHVMYDLDKRDEDVLSAFDRALWFEHTINGASMLQPGRGVLRVGESQFEIAIIREVLGVEVRRFFRAFADEVAENNLLVMRSVDPYDAESYEKHAQLMQVAVERGLHKYPHLAADSSDACTRISLEERTALIASKRLVLTSVVNNVDRLPQRVPNSSQIED